MHKSFEDDKETLFQKCEFIRDSNDDVPIMIDKKPVFPNIDDQK